MERMMRLAHHSANNQGLDYAVSQKGVFPAEFWFA
jgi:hypothetical protein